MADPSRTVSLSGLPADMEEDMLKDKLFIHFLRARNGGGEIESITIVKATPLSALIVFEEREGQQGHEACTSAHVTCTTGPQWNLLLLH